MEGTSQLRDHDERTRFILELEFVQSLSNPQYLLYLAQQRYFQDTRFVNYLAHLQYWKSPDYAKYIVYPHCLYFLDMLQLPQFRAALVNGEVVRLIQSQQFYHWTHRMKPLPKPVDDPVAVAFADKPVEH